MVLTKFPEVRFAKTKMCKFHLQGKCAKGANCSFAHGSNEMERSPDLFRTQLCMALLKTGKCKDSETCKYAHTREQLRALPANADKMIEKAMQDAPRSAPPTPNRQAVKSPGSIGPDTEPLQHSPVPCVPQSPPRSPILSPQMMYVAAVPLVSLHSSDMAPGGTLMVGSPGLMPGLMPSPFGMQWGSSSPYMQYNPCPDSNQSIPRSPPGTMMNDFMLPEPMMLPEAAKWDMSDTLPNAVFQDKAGAAPWTDTTSETTSDGSTDVDKSPVDAGSTSSASSSLPAFEEGFKVTIKNTFLEISPKLAPRSPAHRSSRSVPR